MRSLNGLYPLSHTTNNNNEELYIKEKKTTRIYTLIQQKSSAIENTYNIHLCVGYFSDTYTVYDQLHGREDKKSSSDMAFFGQNKTYNYRM